MKILVVDDNVDSADSLALFLQLTGHEVRLAYDGPRALETAATFLPDVVLLDIGLPGLDGYQVARQLRQRPQRQPPLLIAQTGWGQPEARRRAREAGFDHHLVKPLDPVALQELLAGAVCSRLNSISTANTPVRQDTREERYSCQKPP